MNVIDTAANYSDLTRLGQMRATRFMGCTNMPTEAPGLAM